MWKLKENLLKLENQASMNPMTSSLSGVLISFLNVIKFDDVVNISQEIFSFLPIMFQTEKLLEDAFLILRSLIEPLGDRIYCHIQTILSLALPHLKTYEEVQISRIVVGIIGDLYTVVPLAMEQFTDDLLPCLLSGVVTDSLNLEIRSDILTTLSDYVLNTTTFSYVENIVSILLDTNILQSEELRIAGMELLSSILQTLKDESLKVSLKLHSTKILNLVFSQSEEATGNLHIFVGLLGDLALHFPEIYRDISSNQVHWIKNLVMKGRNSSDTKIRSISVWASEMLMNVYNNNTANNDGMEDHSVIKKARIADDVFYSVNVTVTNKQYITQHIETENVTIKLKSNNKVKTQPQVIQCSDVEATVRLPIAPRPDIHIEHDVAIEDYDEKEKSLTELRNRRKKRTAVSWFDEHIEKRCKDEL